ncbi:ORF17.5 [Retroperitoneal fibromatosis-associated herpesvirus]|nr:ORF17.5 [Retroperitoneal fibromatosis-associated herpesvirus]AGY30700.1 ORF17.5 [Retroperitoneal fibromatosis-associated herpesvirus]
MNVPGNDELISLPKATFLSMLQSSLDGMKQTAARFAPNLSMSGFPGYAVPPEMTVAAYAPPQAPPYLYPCRPHVEGTYYQCPSAVPVSRPGKRKRDDDDGTDHVFPGEEPAIHRDIITMSKSIAEIQSELRDLKHSTLQQRWSHHGQSAMEPRYAPPILAYPARPPVPEFADQPYSYYSYPVTAAAPPPPPPHQPSAPQSLAQPPLPCSTQPATCNPQLSGPPTPAPVGQATQEVPLEASTQPGPPMAQQPPKDTRDSAGPRQGRHSAAASATNPVNASSRHSATTRIQQMFREELLAKQ